MSLAKSEAVLSICRNTGLVLGRPFLGKAKGCECLTKSDSTPGPVKGLAAFSYFTAVKGSYPRDYEVLVHCDKGTMTRTSDLRGSALILFSCNTT